MKKNLILIFSALFIFLGYASIAYSEQFSTRKLIVRFKPGFRENPNEHIRMENLINCNLKPILDKSVAIGNNPKQIIELQSRKLNYNEILKAEEPLLRTFILNFDFDINPKSLSKFLKANYPEIEIAEPYHTYEIQAYTPNDNLFPLQDALNNIKPQEAWEVWRGDPGTIIAISDNGVDQSHEDILPNIAKNSGEIPDNGKDDDGNGFIDDFIGYNLLGAKESDWGNTYNGYYDHGTLVAGIAGAKFNNKIGIAGIGGNCSIFPIKATGSTTAIIYGYESIIYAAQRHFPVLNLSWGGPQAFSELEQNIIDYAVANGVAIVTSGGNIGTNGGTRYDTFYPAGYRGTLGVGEVDEWDQITEDNSCMGVQVDILAPGTGNHSTRNDGGYKTVSYGTSFASPVVAGALALARSKHPNLTPLQAIEFVRLCTDDILPKNSGYSDKKLVPGRLNLYKVVTVDPFSIPSLRPINITWLNSKGIPTNRFAKGDTVRIKLKLKNFLGNAVNVKLKLSTAYDPVSSINIIKDNAQIAFMNTNDELEISDFTLRVSNVYTNRIIFRLDIEADNNFKDLAKFDFIPTASFATFETEKIAFSMSDDGDFGFVEVGNKKEGAGFTLKGIGNQLFGDSGLLISADNTKTVSFIDDNYGTQKKFEEPDQNVNIINDDYSTSAERIGLELTQKVIFPSVYVAQLDITAKNNGSTSIKDLSLGYFYDWDIQEDADSNVAILYDEINNSTIKSQYSSLGAELIYKPGVDIYVGCVAFSKEPGSTPQIAGLDYDYTKNFDKFKQLEILNSGMQLQNNKIYDRSIFTGIKLNGLISPGESKEISLLISGHTSRTELTNNILAVLNTNSVKNQEQLSHIRLIPEPEVNLLTLYSLLPLGDATEIKFYDFSGKEINAKIIENSGIYEQKMLFELPELPTQLIFIRLNSSLHNSTQKVLWIK